MRARTNKAGIAVLAIIAAMALGMFGSSSVPVSREGAASSAQLVSIEQMPDVGEMCLWEPLSAASDRIVSLDESNLFAAFQERPVYAASQDVGATIDVARPPVRNIVDTDPIYSAVTVDTRLNEVYLQDPNTWSIRVFNRWTILRRRRRARKRSG